MNTISLRTDEKDNLLVIRKRLGISSNSSWALKAYVSESTMKRFLNGTPVSVTSFISILEVLQVKDYKNYIEHEKYNEMEYNSSSQDNKNKSILSGGIFMIGKFDVSDWKTIETVAKHLENILLKCKITLLENGTLVVTGTFSECDRDKGIALLDHLKSLLTDCELEWIDYEL
jgi:hypothetical protein